MTERGPARAQAGGPRVVGFATAFAILRGLMLVVLSTALIVAPERAMPGSSNDPARRLAILFTSRTILLGLVLLALAIRRKREALAWVLLADAALQLCDAGMALATAKGAPAGFPAALGALDLWAGLSLLRAGRGPQRSPGEGA